jgi:transposase-like protein
MELGSTLIQAVAYFQDYDNCHKFMINLRWPEGVVRCPRCNSEHVKYLGKARVWKCYGKHESPKFSLKTGTVFENSPIPLAKWLPAVWMIVNDKNGISSWELHRALGVTQKTAWFMLHRIRLAMQGEQGGKLSGNVEVDETFVGGKARNMHKAKKAERIHGTGGADKAIVFGMVECDGRVRAIHVDSRRRHELQKAIRENVEAGAAVFSDELLSYEGLAEDYDHAVINHAVEYVNGNVHTNTMENFWSLLKRSLHGTYVSVVPSICFAISTNKPSATTLAKK